MVEMFRKKSIFDKIDDYLLKRGHEVVFSIFLENYNGNNLFIRFDYDRTISAYKLVWLDLGFFDEKKMDKFISMQIMTNVLADRLVDALDKIDNPGDNKSDLDVYGDRVEVISYQKNVQEFIFSRFLPLEWSFLIDPIVIAFSYLPRSMETILNEFFAKFDGYEEKYNYLKPIKFKINEDSINSLFKKGIISKGKSYYESGNVAFLEKVFGRYIAVVFGVEPYLVIVEEMKDDFVMMWCSCKCDFYCKHLYAVLLSIKEKKFNNFYKVKYIKNDSQSLLEKMANGGFLLCAGLLDDKLLIVGNNSIRQENIIDDKGNLLFEVIEDDDSLTLSNHFAKFKKK